MPPSWDTVFLNATIGCVDVSKDGAFIVVGCNGADGLYLFHVPSGTWENIRPADAARSISAVDFNEAGQLLIGTGGYNNSRPSDATGLFISNDNGNSWLRIPFEYGGQEEMPGVTSIFSEVGDTVFMSVRNSSGVVSAGVYALIPDKGWIQVVQGASSKVIVRSTNVYSYHPISKIVYHANIADISDIVSVPLSTTYGSTTIDTWVGNKILVCKRSESITADSMYLLDGSTLEYAGFAFPFLKSEFVEYFADTLSEASIVVLGGGQNKQVFSSGAEQELGLNSSAPLVDGIIKTDENAIVRIYRHGWYVVDENASVNRVSTELQGQLNAFRQSPDIHPHYAIGLRGNAIVRVTSTSIDTLFGFGSLAYINHICQIDKDNFVASSLDAVFRVDVEADTVYRVDLSGWPTVAIDNDSVPLGIGMVFAIGDSLLAWAEGGNVPAYSYPNGGLFSMIGGAWERVDNNMFGHKTNLSSAILTSDHMLLTARQAVQGGGFSLPVIASSDHGRASAALQIVSDDSCVVPDVSATSVTDGGWIWGTNYGYTWFTDRASKARASTRRYGTVSHTCTLGNSVLLATSLSGVIILKDVEYPTSIRDVTEHVVTAELEAYPIPVTSESHTLNVRVRGCLEREHHLRLFGITGEIALETSDASLEIRNTKGIPTGVSMIIATGRQNACRHTCLIVKN